MLLHGATYIVAAGIVSGALNYGAWALLASPAGPWALPGAVTLVVLVAAAPWRRARGGAAKARGRRTRQRDQTA